MAILTSYEILLLNLQQKISKKEEWQIYGTAEDAYTRLKQRTGQDFGYDAVAWEKWLRENVEYALPKIKLTDIGR